MSAPRNEHLVVIMLEAVPTDTEFEVWPPHITIVPWFPCDDGERLDRLLAAVAKKHQPFAVKTGKIEEWGSRQKFRVMKIEGGWRLLSLHWAVFRGLEKSGFSVHQKEYMGEKYTPHVTLRNRLSDQTLFKSGGIISVDHFTLVRQLRLRGSGRMIKSLVRDYELG